MFDYPHGFHLFDHYFTYTNLSMLKTLILVRHAQAGHEVGQSDFNRPLTAIGQRDARHLGRWIAEQVSHLDEIRTSAALRAKTTAEAIAEEINPGKEPIQDDELYEAPIRVLLERVHATDASITHLALVGHNPGMTFLADYLSPAPVCGMRPGSAVILTFENMDWNEIEKNKGTLKNSYNI